MESREDEKITTLQKQLEKVYEEGKKGSTEGLEVRKQGDGDETRDDWVTRKLDPKLPVAKPRVGELNYNSQSADGEKVGAKNRTSREKGEGKEVEREEVGRNNTVISVQKRL